MPDARKKPTKDVTKGQYKRKPKEGPPIVCSRIYERIQITSSNLIWIVTDLALPTDGAVASTYQDFTKEPLMCQPFRAASGHRCLGDAAKFPLTI